MATLHVWKNSPAPAIPYATKKSGAHTITAALAAAAAGDTVTVHGDCAGGARCIYRENVVVKLPGIKLIGVHWPIIDGGNAGRCVDFVSRSNNLSRLDSFEIKNGFAAGGNGGGVRVQETCAMIVRNCIHQNVARDGAGVAVERTQNQFIVGIINNEIHHNLAEWHGGGIAVIGNETIPKAPIPVAIDQNRIHHNSAGNASGNFIHGGGISIYRDRANVNGNDIFENEATGRSEHQGGGIGVFNVDETRDSQAGNSGLFVKSWSTIATPQAKLTGNHIHQNKASDGGGVSGMWAASLVYNNNLIENNNTTDDGGGVYGSVVSHHDFAGGNKISTNVSASNGGGIHITCSSRIQFSGGNIVEGNIATKDHGGGVSVRNSEISCSAVLHIKGNKAGKKGGGIFVWTTGLGHVIYLACEMDSLMELTGALVESNAAGDVGGGICVEKDEDNWVTRRTAIDKSIVRGNVSTGSKYSGIAFLGSSHAYRPEVRESLIEDHKVPHGAVGIFARGTPAHRIEISLEDSVVRGNFIGVAGSYVRSGKVEGNSFSGQIECQILLGVRAEILAQKNILEGGGTTADGIRCYQKKPILPGRYTNNSITGHALYGINTFGQLRAPRNWWGHISGPGNPGADKVTMWVIWSPPLSAAPVGVVAPGTVAITPPSAPVLVPPTFSMPSTIFPDLKCGAMGPATPPSTASATA